MSSLSKPKIAYLISQYPAVSLTFILREIIALRRLGFSIHIASINKPDLPPQGENQEENEETAQTYYVKNTFIGKAIWNLIKTAVLSPVAFFRGLLFSIKCGGTDLRKCFLHLCYFAEAILVGCWMQKHQLSHIHVHFANPASTVALILTKIFPVHFSMTVHGPDVFYEMTLNHMRKKVEAAHFVCCISHYAKSQLMSASSHSDWSKLEITPLGVNPYVFSPRPFREIPTPFEILCVGRLVAVKGHGTLIESLKSLTQQGRTIHLKIVGNGPEMQSLQEEVRKHGLTSCVSFTGALDQKSVIQAYQEADLFVLPSFAEGVPIVLMEAMAMEIPCIATQIAGIPELIRHGVDGLIVPPANVLEITNSITFMIENPKERLRLGQAGRQRILEKYNLEPNVERLANVFTKRLVEQ